MAQLMSSTLPAITSQATYSDIALLAFSVIGLTGYCSNGKLWNKPDPFQYKLFERPQLLDSAKASPQTTLLNTRDVARQLEELTKDGVIFWASQSGRAEGFAHRLEKELGQRFRLQALVADLSDYDADTIALIPTSKFAIFVMSTYGEGDPPDNGWSFWDWIKATNEESTLDKLQYAAFGLGNSNYRYYNKVIDVVASTFDSRGATALLPTGRADDAKNDTEEDFLTWKENLFQALRVKHNLQEHQVSYQPTINIAEQSTIRATLEQSHLPLHIRSSEQISGIVEVPLRKTNMVTSVQSSKSCLHMEFDLSSHPQTKYKTGDHLLLWPKNTEGEVSRLLRVLGRTDTCDKVISISHIESSHSQTNLPSPITLKSLFQHHLEICAPVSREVVQGLSEFVTSDSVNRAFDSMTSTKVSYTSFATTKHITLGRLLEYAQEIDPSVSWSGLPITYVLEHLKPMAPRYYSISSSSIVSPRFASITVSDSSTVLPTTPTVTIPGLAYSHLSRFLPDGQLSSIRTPNLTIQLRRSDFKLPFSSSTPLILIAAGSGIAPIRAFLHERARLASIGRESGQILFFYGCRHPEHDYLYRKEIEDFAEGALKSKLEVVPAFSRLGGSKVYVQDRITEKAGAVAKLLLDDNASLYICGSTVMAKAAGDRVVDSVKSHGSLQGKQGEKWRAELKRFKRWQEDVWG